MSRVNNIPNLKAELGFLRSQIKGCCAIEVTLTNQNDLQIVAYKDLGGLNYKQVRATIPKYAAEDIMAEGIIFALLDNVERELNKDEKTK